MLRCGQSSTTRRPPRNEGKQTSMLESVTTCYRAFHESGSRYSAQCKCKFHMHLPNTNCQCPCSNADVIAVLRGVLLASLCVLFSWLVSSVDTSYENHELTRHVP